MEKTPFIGLTILEPGESIYADNSAFISRDRREIDRGLHIGIKTHRHDGTAGLANPLAPPSGLVVGSGGTIGAGLSLTLGYTLEDASGGETLLSPTTLVTTPGQMEAPQVAPTALVKYTEGTLDTDTFTYAITWDDGEGGETPMGPSVTITRDPGFANGQIELNGLAVGMAEAGAVGWRLYRARSGGNYVFLAEGATEKFVDDGTSVAQCDVHPPSFNVNTTGAINQLQYTLPSEEDDPEIAKATWLNLYCSLSGDFNESSLLLQVPVGSAGAEFMFTSLEFLDAQPPDVNRSYGGANKIDPDQELIDWHWKRPVVAFADLPTKEEGAEDGDVRAVKEEALLYTYKEETEEWIPLQGQAATLTAEGMGVIVSGEEVTTPRGTAFAQYTWIAKEGFEPENRAEFDIIIFIP